MALRLLWFPSSLLSSEQHNRAALTLHKSCHPKLSLSSLFCLSFSTSHISQDIFASRTKTTRTPNLLAFQISSVTQLQSSSSTVDIEIPEPDSEIESRTRLIAQNVPWTCTSEDIQNLFAKYGTVIDVELSMHNKTRNRGLAFIRMGSEEEALAALTNLESYELEGRAIKVNYAKTLKKKPSAAPQKPVSKHNVFVGNLSWKARSSDLREFFSSEGGYIVSAEVVFQSNPRRSTGYGFVSFGSKEAAKAAVTAFNGKKFMGRPIRLTFSRRKLEGESKENPQIEKVSTENSIGGLSEKTDEM